MSEKKLFIYVSILFIIFLFSIITIWVQISGTENIFVNVEEENMQKNKYISKYEWNLKDIKIDEITFDNESNENYYYVVLGVENKDGDLEGGEYVIKTNDNKKASFMIYITEKYYDKESDIPMDNYEGMVQGFDNSELSVTLKKGQYLYLSQNYNGQGKVLVIKK